MRSSDIPSCCEPLALRAFVRARRWSRRSYLGAWRDRRVDFPHDVPLGVDAEAMRQRLLDREVQLLVAEEFTTVAHVSHTTILERRYIPGWAFAVAILLFPIGLVALVSRNRETITIASSGAHCKSTAAAASPWQTQSLTTSVALPASVPWCEPASAVRVIIALVWWLVVGIVLLLCAIWGGRWG